MQHDVNECLGALNHLWGGRASREAGETAEVATPAHLALRERVLVACKSVPPDPEPGKTEEALRALLQGASAYESSCVKVAPYRKGQVSLPADVRNCPSVLDVVPALVREKVVRFEQTMLRPPEALAQLQAACPVQPYHDRVLAQKPAVYAQLLRDLDHRGLLHWTLAPKCRASMFFVLKRIMHFASFWTAEAPTRSSRTHLE